MFQFLISCICTPNMQYTTGRESNDVFYKSPPNSAHWARLCSQPAWFGAGAHRLATARLGMVDGGRESASFVCKKARLGSRSRGDCSWLDRRVVAGNGYERRAG